MGVKALAGKNGGKEIIGEHPLHRHPRPCAGDLRQPRDVNRCQNVLIMCDRHRSGLRKEGTAKCLKVGITIKIIGGRNIKETGTKKKE
ncbi:hypothetical protein IM40_05740 [Candidatus Paracaedimonas acanthamoebae]|nr:hypothetical protein IM40_05740 [Candidatus Paracaedimonas acanthamoebae]